jgi:plastocyanin
LTNGWILAGALLVPLSGCNPVDPDLMPDQQLRAELGLTDHDRVYTVSISTGVGELADPGVLAIEAGVLVQFVSTDWFVHEVRFDLDAMALPAKDFLERTGQTASQPLLQEGSRMVLTFDEAPAGRYPYVLQGNRESGEGEIVVVAPGGR